MGRIAPVGLPAMARRHLPFEALNPAKARHSPEEVAAYQPDTPQPVTYTDGVYPVAGQHKGALLRILLHRLGKQYPAIVFLGDGTKNVCGMTQAFQDSPDVLTAFPYDGERLPAETFLHSTERKAVATRDWDSITGSLPAVCKSVPEACGPKREPKGPVVEKGMPKPPADLAGETLRAWLKANWYDGKHRALGYNPARRAAVIRSGKSWTSLRSAGTDSRPAGNWSRPGKSSRET